MNPSENVFAKSAWIWRKDQAADDEFVDFADTFFYEGDAPVILHIAADSNYTVWLNGRLATFGQYADYPTYKVYDTVDLTALCQAGKNRLAITVWYYGTDSQTYIRGHAGLIYEVVSNIEILAYSDKITRSRLAPDYISHEGIEISFQLGLTYHYDCKGDDGFRRATVGDTDCFDGFDMSRVVPDISRAFHARPNQKLLLGERIDGKLRGQGLFSYRENRPADYSAAEEMQYAALSFRPLSVMRAQTADTLHGEKGSGIYFIVDLGAETAGFLDIDLDLPSDCRIDVGFGEHLDDGRCRTAVRHFACRLEGKKGRNTYLHTFRRFGCRYLQFFVHADTVTVHYAGLRPTLYPFSVKPYDTGDLLRNTVYEVCVNTLQHCMHEHYEDCPWREQALYVMDSRNQMLCGYYAFGEYEAPRAALKLISMGMRPDGLLTLCYPAGRDAPIPSFSTMYFVQMEEYIRHSGDTTLAEECFPVLCRLAKTFTDRLGENDLMETFAGPGGYWNFYEWSPTMEGHFNEQVPHLEAPLNAYLSLALDAMAKICDSLGKEKEATEYRALRERINRALLKTFYNQKDGLFFSFADREQSRYSVLTNALCLLCGAADGVRDKQMLLRVLASNGKDNGGLSVIPNTLSMNSFRFDALLRENRALYAPVILSEIDSDYLYMLRAGATSFWETIEGASAFADAGSLCHGWSALPIYYYHTLLPHSASEY